MIRTGELFDIPYSYFTGADAIVVHGYLSTLPPNLPGRRSTEIHNAHHVTIDLSIRRKSRTISRVWYNVLIHGRLLTQWYVDDHYHYWFTQCQWKPRVVIMPTLPSPVVPHVVVTTCGATSYEKIGIMIILSFNWPCAKPYCLRQTIWGPSQ